MQARDVQTLTLGDPAYPKLLREIHGPPDPIHFRQGAGQYPGLDDVGGVPGGILGKG